MAVGDDPTFGTSSAIGRYFGVVSTLPSLILTFWICGLLLLEPWGRGPSVDRLLKYNPLDNLGQAVMLLGAAIAAAVVLHPIQFGIVQVLEGYWGPTELGRSLATWRTMVHLRTRQRANDLVARAASANVYPNYLAGARLATEPAKARATVQAYVDDQSAEMLLARYPDAPEHTLPTRLGNVLRRYEARAGSAVGLDLATWATHIGMVAEPSHTAYVQDQRQIMDLAAKMTAVGMLATLVTLGLMWPHGFWALLALVPFVAAWASYRGAVVAASSYGLAVTAWLDLNRFALYERLALPLPLDTDEERVLTAVLDDFSEGSDDYWTTYVHRSQPKPAAELASAPKPSLLARLRLRPQPE